MTRLPFGWRPQGKKPCPPERHDRSDARPSANLTEDRRSAKNLTSRERDRSRLWRMVGSARDVLWRARLHDARRNVARLRRRSANTTDEIGRRKNSWVKDKLGKRAGGRATRELRCRYDFRWVRKSRER